MFPQEADDSCTTTQTILLNSKVVFPKFSSWTLMQNKLGLLMLQSHAKLNTNKIKLEPHCCVVNRNTASGHLNPSLINLSKELIKKPLSFILKYFPFLLALLS